MHPKVDGLDSRGGSGARGVTPEVAVAEKTDAGLAMGQHNLSRKEGGG